MKSLRATLRIWGPTCGNTVVDEGYQFQNIDCKCKRLDDISDVESFQEWLAICLSSIYLPRKPHLVEQIYLHNICSSNAILKPFLLRRIKAGVLQGKLPPKKQYVVYTPLTRSQKEFNGAILDGKESPSRTGEGEPGLAASLLSLEAKKIDKVESEKGFPMKLSEAKLHALLDRLSEVFSSNVKGEDSWVRAGEKRSSVYSGGGEKGEDMIQKLLGRDLRKRHLKIFTTQLSIAFRLAFGNMDSFYNTISIYILGAFPH
ncbi:hypothetical protein DL96DRAFT_1553486 [Flagelloscypha sp. PMI_526]|nr:hypothetical protein DL96DRAFT_1553486 [Flagelloscypha sp. PMI_526]